MGRYGVIHRRRDEVIKDLEGTTFSLGILGKKYGVTRQALSQFVKKEKIKRRPKPHRPVKHHVKDCLICQEILQDWFLNSSPLQKREKVHVTLTNQ
jgi:hypothetical protein